MLSSSFKCACSDRAHGYIHIDGAVRWLYLIIVLLRTCWWSIAHWFRQITINSLRKKKNNNNSINHWVVLSIQLIDLSYRESLYYSVQMNTYLRIPFPPRNMINLFLSASRFLFLYFLFVYRRIHAYKLLGFRSETECWYLPAISACSIKV